MRRLISYNVEKDERAVAYLAIPLGVDFPAPTIVALHGTSVHGKDILAGLIDKPGYPGQAHLNLLAREGYVVIAPDHFNMGQRTPPGGYVTAPFYRRHPDWTALGKIVYDASIAIDVLQTLEEVDTQRIGATGVSLGGQGTIMLAAYDSRIRVAACTVGAMPFQFNTDFRQYGIRPVYSYYPHLQRLFEKNELPPIDLHEIIALIAPRPFLDVSALEDKYGGSIQSGRQRVLMHLAISRVYHLEGAPQNYAFYTHGQGHSFQHDVRALTYAWLDKHLKSESETTPPAVKDK